MVTLPCACVPTYAFFLLKSIYHPIPYTPFPGGIDLTTHSSSDRDVITRPRRQGIEWATFFYVVFLIIKHPLGPMLSLLKYRVGGIESALMATKTKNYFLIIFSPNNLAKKIGVFLH
jgi:hypothetical protein